MYKTLPKKFAVIGGRQIKNLGITSQESTSTDNQEVYSNILHATDVHKFYNHLKQSDLNKDLMSHEEILSKNTVLQTISVEKQEESEKLKDFVFPNLKDKFAGG